MYLTLAIIAYLVVMNILMRKKRKPTRNMMMTLGRGGHTAEMLYMSQRYNFDKKFDKVYMLIADDDQLTIDRSYTFWKANNVSKESIFLSSSIIWHIFQKFKIEENCSNSFRLV